MVVEIQPTRNKICAILYLSSHPLHSTPLPHLPPPLRSPSTPSPHTVQDAVLPGALGFSIQQADKILQIPARINTPVIATNYGHWHTLFPTTWSPHQAYSPTHHTSHTSPPTSRTTELTRPAELCSCTQCSSCPPTKIQSCQKDQLPNWLQYTNQPTTAPSSYAQPGHCQETGRGQDPVGRNLSYPTQR